VLAGNVSVNVGNDANVKVALGVKLMYARKVAVELDTETVVSGVLAAACADPRATLNAGAPDGSAPEPATVIVPLPLAAAGITIDALTFPARIAAVAAEFPIVTVVEVGTVFMTGGVVALLLVQPTPRATTARATAGMENRRRFMEDLLKTSALALTLRRLPAHTMQPAA
jgi:hypothetical protein